MATKGQEFLINPQMYAWLSIRYDWEIENSTDQRNHDFVCKNNHLKESLFKALEIHVNVFKYLVTA